MKVRYSRLCEALLGYEYSRFLMSIFMENLGNIQKAEAQGRRGFAAAKDRMKGLLPDAVPPGLDERREDVELNRLDLVARLYRDAYESVRPLIEDQALVNRVAKNWRQVAREGAKKGSSEPAWDAIRGVATLRTLDLWDKLPQETRAEIEGYLRNQTFIDSVTDSEFFKKEGYDIYMYACLAIRNGADLRISGFSDMFDKERQKQIVDYFKSQECISAASERVLFHVENVGKKRVNSSYPWAVMHDIADLHILGIWGMIGKDIRNKMDQHLKSPAFIKDVAESVRIHAIQATDISFARIAVLDGAALKTLAEYYELEAEKLREKQGAEAARNPRSDKGLPNIPTIKAF